MVEAEAQDAPCMGSGAFAPLTPRPSPEGRLTSESEPVRTLPSDPPPPGTTGMLRWGHAGPQIFVKHRGAFLSKDLWAPSAGNSDTN